MIDCKRCQDTIDYCNKKMNWINGQGSVYFRDHQTEYILLKYIKNLLTPVVTKEELKKRKVIK